MSAGDVSASGIPAAVIFGVGGKRLSAEEKAFFAEVNPFGYILFTRNCESPEQVRALVSELNDLHGRAVLPVLIDQEGGRVARLRPPYWRASPPAGKLAAIAGCNIEQACEAIRLNARLIASELRGLGINVNCAPVADILIEGAHQIVGDRAYGSDPEQVATLASAMADGLMEGGVLPVLKHIPGHGRALADSHEALPVVDTKLEELRRTDFVPFKRLNNLPFAMTAHVLYTAIDPNQLATVSPAAIRLIREELGFDGCLMSDDLSMHAMTGDFGERTQRTLDAGCDLVLHCNGNMEEMQSIARQLRPMTKQAAQRANRALAMLKDPLPLDSAMAEAQLQEWLKQVA